MSETCAMFVEVLLVEFMLIKQNNYDGQMTLKNKVGNCNNTVEHKET